jgi:hypothetical protein
MVSVSTASRPAETRAQKIWQFLGGATVTFAFYTLAMGSPLRHLAWDNFAYGGVLAGVPSVLLIALLAPLVSYRRRDVLLLLVPIWGLVVMWTIGSRIAMLPLRDWPLRPDEIDRETTTQVRSP